VKATVRRSSAANEVHNVRKAVPWGLNNLKRKGKRKMGKKKKKKRKV